MRNPSISIILTLATAIAGCSGATEAPSAPVGEQPNTVDVGEQEDTLSQEANLEEFGQVTSTAVNPVCRPHEGATVRRCGAAGLPPCNTWLKVEPRGALCGDGSQYKFFVNYSGTSNNLEIDFEPGGACFDYDSCTGATGSRGAANPNGIPDNHMQTEGLTNLLRRDGSNPVQDYNFVFVPYCTGDVHTGNRTARYSKGSKSIVYRHRGHANTMAVIDWVKNRFSSVPKLFVTGCSAGGAGAMLNYSFIRSELANKVQCGYLLDDSGPIFTSNGPSKLINDAIRAAWNVDPIIDKLALTLDVSAARIKADFAFVNQAIARKYPRDRLSLALYQKDLVYSAYSYQTFYPDAGLAGIRSKWLDDVRELTGRFDGEPNLAYFIPLFRADNCSHCLTIPPVDEPNPLASPWLRSGIQSAGFGAGGFILKLLNPDQKLMSYYEGSRPNASFTAAEVAACLKP